MNIKDKDFRKGEDGPKRPHADRSKNYQDFLGFICFYDFEKVYVPAVPEYGLNTPALMQPHEYWFKIFFDNNAPREPYGCVVQRPANKGPNLWPRNGEQKSIDFDQSSFDFRNCVNQWFKALTSKGKVKRKDGKPFFPNKHYRPSNAEFAEVS